MNRRSEDGFHVASLAYAGRLWTAYLEFDDDPHDPRTYRARIRFEPAAPEDDQGATRTTVLIIESSYEEAMAKARAFDERQLAGLLRSALPDDWEEEAEADAGTGSPLEAPVEADGAPDEDAGPAADAPSPDAG